MQATIKVKDNIAFLPIPPHTELMGSKIECRICLIMDLFLYFFILIRDAKLKSECVYIVIMFLSSL